MAIPFGSQINMKSQKIINVLDPTTAQDAATKNYVDTHGGGGGATAMWVTNIVTASRVSGTVYQNTSVFPMLVMIHDGATGTATATAVCDVNPAPTTVVSTVSNVNGFGVMIEFIVPPGYYYKVSGANFAVAIWREYIFTKGNATQAFPVRALSTVYQNTSGSLMFVLARITGAGSTAVAVSDANPAPTTVVIQGKCPGGVDMSLFFPVLPGHYYKVTASVGALAGWTEYTVTGITASRSVALSHPLILLATPTSTGPPLRTYVNTTGVGVFVIICGHSNATSTLIITHDPAYTVAGSPAALASIGTPGIPPNLGASVYSSNAADLRNGAVCVNPNEGYAVVIDAGTPTLDNWMEWYFS